MLLLRLRLTVLTGSTGWPQGEICDFFTHTRGGIGDRSRLQVEGVVSAGGSSGLTARGLRLDGDVDGARAAILEHLAWRHRVRRA